jgi:hypothetical protein
VFNTSYSMFSRLSKIVLSLNILYCSVDPHSLFISGMSIDWNVCILIVYYSLIPGTLCLCYSLPHITKSCTVCTIDLGGHQLPTGTDKVITLLLYPPLYNSHSITLIFLAHTVHLSNLSAIVVQCLSFHYCLSLV